MGIISWIVVGAVAGLLAKFLMPGNDPGGFIVTIIVGIVGGLIGGWISTQMGWGMMTGFNIKSILIATGGAVLLLVILRVLRGRRA